MTFAGGVGGFCYDPFAAPQISLDSGQPDIGTEGYPDSRFTLGSFTTGGFTGAPVPSVPPITPVIATPRSFGIFRYGSPYGWSFPPPLSPFYLPTGYGFMGYGGTVPPSHPPDWPGDGGYGGYGGYGGDTPGRMLHVTAGVVLDPIGGYAERVYSRTGEPSPVVPTRAIPHHPPVVYVLDQDRKMIAAIDGYALWEWSAWWRAPHECRLVMNVHVPGAADLIARGVYLLAWTESGVLRVAEIETIDEAGDVAGIESEMITVLGRDYSRHYDGRVALSQVLSGDGYDTWTKSRGSAAQAMAYFLNANALAPAPERDSIPEASLLTEFRKLNLLDIGIIPAVDVRLDYAARFQYLNEILYEIGIAADIGYETVYDRDRDRFVFNVLPGRIAQFPPVLSLERGTAGSIRAKRSVRDAKNYAIAAGQGEGAARSVYGIMSNVANNAGPPFPNNEDRSELFVDARDCARNDPNIAYSSAINERALTRLSEFQPEESVEATLAPNGLIDYPRDVALGDLLVVDHEPHARLAARLIGAIERYDVESGRTVDLILGAEGAGLMAKQAGFNRRRSNIYRI